MLTGEGGGVRFAPSFFAEPWDWPVFLVNLIKVLTLGSETPGDGLGWLPQQVGQEGPAPGPHLFPGRI